MEITKADLTSGVELPGATLVLTDKAGDTIEEWVSTDEAHVIHGLIPGEYVLTETIAPEGTFSRPRWPSRCRTRATCRRSS